MGEIQVGAGKTMLEGLVRTPPVGLCELVWNAFDEDATTVRIEIETQPLGGVELIRVVDNGNGMNRRRAEASFSKVGDSWKLMPGTLSTGGRPVHGRHGRGRYAAFSLGNSVRWISTSAPVDSEDLATIQVKGQRATLDLFQVEDVLPGEEAAGTRVEIETVTLEAAAAFDEPTPMRQRLLTEFALHLERHADFTIELLGATIEPSAVIADRVNIELELPDGIAGPAVLTVIEWALPDVERRLYLCRSDGAVVDDIRPGIQAVGAQFTAYIAWDGFSHDQGLLLDGDTGTPAGQVVQAATTALRAHLVNSPAAERPKRSNGGVPRVSIRTRVSPQRPLRKPPVTPSTSWPWRRPGPSMRASPSRRRPSR